MKHEEIICAGFGGQGIMLMGKILITTGLKEGYNVTGLPSYGAEVRGGTAHAMLHIAKEEIPDPTIKSPTTCIIMNKPSLDKFLNRIRKGGLAIVNTSMTGDVPPKKNINIVNMPLTELASDLGNVQMANMVAIGAFTKLKKLFSLKSVLDTLETIFVSKGKSLGINKVAIELGFNKV